MSRYMMYIIPLSENRVPQIPMVAWYLSIYIYIYIVIRIQFASLRTLQPTSQVFGTSFSNQLHVFAASQAQEGPQAVGG